jgi:hypothetical protein
LIISSGDLTWLLRATLRMQPRNEKFLTLSGKAWLECRRERRHSHGVRAARCRIERGAADPEHSLMLR